MCVCVCVRIMMSRCSIRLLIGAMSNIILLHYNTIDAISGWDVKDSTSIKMDKEMVSIHEDPQEALKAINVGIPKVYMSTCKRQSQDFTYHPCYMYYIYTCMKLIITAKCVITVSTTDLCKAPLHTYIIYTAVFASYSVFELE